MNSSKKQKVSTLSVTDSEEQLNTNVDDEEQANGNLKIKKLNHDCLAQVLMHLPVLDRLEMEKVCKKWEEATQMSSYNFKKLNFNDLIITLDKKEETWKMILEKYGRYLKDLTINYEYSWICNVITKKCQNITRFDIDMSFRNNEHDEEYLLEVFFQAVTLMPKLKYLKIRIKTYEFYKLPTGLLKLLPSDIEEIHLLATPQFDDFARIIKKPTISVVPDKFKSIRCLTLQGCCLDQSVIELILLNAITLVHLDLSGCDSTPDASVLAKLYNLEYLNLDRMENINVNVITTIAHNCHKLKHFEYGKEIYDDNDDEFQEMDIVPQRVFSELKYLINLEHLNFQGLDLENTDDNFLSPIVNNCKKLKHLNIDYGAHFAASNIKEITKLKNLQSINLQFAKLNSELLIDLANNCLELKNLNATIQNVTKAALGKLKNLKKLEKLKFHYCESLTGNLLIDIVDNCKNLIDLDLRGCHNVTEASLLQVGKLQNLKRLNIDFIVNAPNAMFDNFCKLEYLSCCGCPSVTDEGIMKLIDNCENLNHLNIFKSGVTVETVIHASRRQCVFKILNIIVDYAIKNAFYRKKTDKPHYLRF